MGCDANFFVRLFPFPNNSFVHEKIEQIVNHTYYRAGRGALLLLKKKNERLLKKFRVTKLHNSDIQNILIHSFHLSNIQLLVPKTLTILLYPISLTPVITLMPLIPFVKGLMKLPFESRKYLYLTWRFRRFFVLYFLQNSTSLA